MKRYIEGIKFGMILQLIIGPMCLLVFHTSSNNGFLKTIPTILVIASVDALYISLASMGVSKLLKKKKIINFIKTGGSFILILFGIATVLNEFGINLIPTINLGINNSNELVQTYMLALSNPVTITFWGSVLTSKIVNEKFKKRELLFFCFGLVSATLLFLSFVAIIGVVFHKFLPNILIKMFNIAVGIYISFYGFTKLFEKK